VTEEQLRDLASFERSEAFTPLEKRALQLTVALSRTPADVPDELYDALRAELDEGQLVELGATIAWENYRARFNRLFGIQSQGFSEGASCALPERLTET
jgi:4-carboxymuconolactone decarboxylase